jgi:hypothetical protein
LNSNGLGTAIADIERSGMTAAAKTRKGIFCHTKMLRVKSNSRDGWCFDNPLDHLRRAGETFVRQCFTQSTIA